MKEQEIREIVGITIEELLKRHALKEPYERIKGTVEARLKRYYQDGDADEGISYALSKLQDDEYIDIFYLQYGNNAALEQIAEIMKRDVSTITRNKKRLIIEIYDLIGTAK